MNLFISSAEPSGDIIAAEVLQAFKAQLNVTLKVSGIGGPYSEKEGLTSLFPLTDITVHGFTEVLPKIPLILKRIRQTVEHILSENPDLVITIDAYDFHIRVTERLRKKGYKGKIVHLVAPAVWAWGKGRAKKLMSYYNGLYCLLPFEPQYFQQEGFIARYVGNPVLQRFANIPFLTEFKQRHQINEKAFILTVLPGSRDSELKRLLPTFLGTIKLLQPYLPNLHVIIPTFSHFEVFIRDHIKNYDFPITIIPQEDKASCFNVTNFGIAASGTVALELGLFNFPFVIAYKTSSLTAFIARRIATSNYVCLINILANKMIVPEILQENCTPENMQKASLPLLQDERAIQAFLNDKNQAMKQIGASKESMPVYFVDCVLKEILGFI